MTESVPTLAKPTTTAQRARVSRILDVATMLVTSGGEDALQMSDLPKLAHVSLAALYRYFPSKQHLLFAVVENHLESVLTKIQPTGSGTASVRERTVAQLIRAFHLDQRIPNLGRVVRRMSSLADPAYSAERERLARLHTEIMLRAVGPMTDRQQGVLWLVLTAADAATQHWFAGILSAEEVHFQILMVSRLLDLPEEQIAADWQAAERAAH